MRPPPIPPPWANPFSYMSGRDCYEVEQEILSLWIQLEPAWYRRLFQRAWWRLRLLQLHYGTNAEDVVNRRLKYYDQQLELGL